jgi:hypothetical protein
MREFPATERIGYAVSIKIARQFRWDQNFFSRGEQVYSRGQRNRLRLR